MQEADPRLAAASPGQVARLHAEAVVQAGIAKRGDQGAPHLAKFDTPALVVQGTADTGVFPSDARKIFDHIGSTDKELELVKGAHYFEDSDADRDAVADLMAAWIERKA